MAITFKYDDDGNLIAYDDGKKVGPIVTMGDNVKAEGEEK